MGTAEGAERRGLPTKRYGRWSVQLVLLHALPLDGSMWSAHMNLLAGATIAPTLYGFGDTLQEWAAHVLAACGEDDELILVGNSIGGSCALEIAVLAPHRVAAIVIAGSKAGHRPEPSIGAAAISMLQREGVGPAWASIWEPSFAPSAHPDVVARAKSIALQQSPIEVARGVSAFHSRLSREGFVERWDKQLVVISGEYDATPTPSAGAATAALARRGRHHVIADCGHYVPLEQPTVFAEIVGEVIAAAR